MIILQLKASVSSNYRRHVQNGTTTPCPSVRLIQKGSKRLRRLFSTSLLSASEATKSFRAPKPERLRPMKLSNLMTAITASPCQQCTTLHRHLSHDCQATHLGHQTVECGVYDRREWPPKSSASSACQSFVQRISMVGTGCHCPAPRQWMPLAPAECTSGDITQNKLKRCAHKEKRTSLRLKVGTANQDAITQCVLSDSSCFSILNVSRRCKRR